MGRVRHAEQAVDVDGRRKLVLGKPIRVGRYGLVLDRLEEAGQSEEPDPGACFGPYNGSVQQAYSADTVGEARELLLT